MLVDTAEGVQVGVICVLREVLMLFAQHFRCRSRGSIGRAQTHPTVWTFQEAEAVGGSEADSFNSRAEMAGQRTLGSEHPDILLAINNLAICKDNIHKV